MTLDTSVPATSFLDAYPHPAFALPILQATSGRLPFDPVYANPAYKALFIPEQDSATHQNLALLESLESPAEVGKLRSWLLEPLSVREKYSNVLLRFRPHWLHSQTPSLELELTCTQLDGFWLCTSVPRSTNKPPHLPSFTTDPVGVKPAERLDLLSTPIGLQLEHLPKLSDLVALISADSSSQGAQPSSDHIEEIAHLVETHPWHLTPLGPRERWPRSLVTALNICLICPFQVCQLGSSVRTGPY
jgi:hypothetical protein